jgi:alkanesulfonate monooxygenase SsuD/methylene tetrahydromethanopterin reductase-like flavin-dependent oxidoreductase (luciferase family)
LQAEASLVLRNILTLPNGGECGDPVFVVELTERAEAAGWDAVLLEDYICYQGDPSVPTCDVWATLGAMAAKTSRVRIGTSVTPLPRAAHGRSHAKRRPSISSRAGV